MYLTSISSELKNESNAIKQGNGSHAYIIEGERGIGKYSLALALACTYFCASMQPCFECAACKKILSGNHPDVHIVFPEKGVIKVEQIREILSGVYETPYEGNVKIYIIKEFNLATQQAQNALLKTLEEPPENVIFILLAENALQLLPTVRSRCKRLKIKKHSKAEIEEQLNILFESNERNSAAAQNSGGNIGKAIKLASDEEYIRLDAAADELYALIKKGDSACAAVMLEREKDSFLEIVQLLEDKIYDEFLRTHDRKTLARINILEDMKQAKKENVNQGLICVHAAYALVKGREKWQR